MSISTYAELVTAYENHLHRSDLTARVPEFITLGEARIGREIQCRQMEASTTAASAVTVALPDDFVSIKAVRITGAEVGWLDYISPEQFFSTIASAGSSTRKTYTIFGGLVFPTAPSSTVEIWYYKKLTALSSSVNTLFTVNPDLYLYAGLCSSAPYLRNDGRIAVWEGLYAMVKDSVNTADKRGRYPAGMAVKLA